MRASFLLTVLLAAGVVAATAVSCGASPCAQTCSGCCTADGQCLEGQSTDACGREGNACVSCGVERYCGIGVCREPLDGGYLPPLSEGFASCPPRTNARSASVEVLTPPNANGIDRLSVHAGYLYWSFGSFGSVVRMALDGGSSEQLTSSPYGPTDYAVDDGADGGAVIYFGADNGDLRVLEVGADASTLVATQLSALRFGLDDEWIYYLHCGADCVKKVPRDGGRAIVLSDSNQCGLGGFTVSPTGVYWSADLKTWHVSKAGGTTTEVAPFRCETLVATPTGALCGASNGVWRVSIGSPPDRLLERTIGAFAVDADSFYVGDPSSSLGAVWRVSRRDGVLEKLADGQKALSIATTCGHVYWTNAWDPVAPYGVVLRVEQ